jgi:small subunit ribosomal protein S6
MKEKRKNLYEGMYVISASLSDDARSKALERIKEGISRHGGEVLFMHDWGRKRLAYEINGHREGFYYILYFEVNPSAIAEMWHEYHLNEDLVRFITLRTDKVVEKIEFKTLQEVQ